MRQRWQQWQHASQGTRLRARAPSLEACRVLESIGHACYMHAACMVRAWCVHGACSVCTCRARASVHLPARSMRPRSLVAGCVWSASLPIIFQIGKRSPGKRLGGQTRRAGLGGRGAPRPWIRPPWQGTTTERRRSVPLASERRGRSSRIRAWPRARGRASKAAGGRMGGCGQGHAGHTAVPELGSEQHSAVDEMRLLQLVDGQQRSDEGLAKVHQPGGQPHERHARREAAAARHVSDQRGPERVGWVVQ